MSLETKIQKDITSAMKEKDKARLRTLRALKSEIVLAKTDGTGRVIDDTAELKMIQKLIKQRQESLEIYAKEGRDDLAQHEQEEITVLNEYLPTQMSNEEVSQVVDGIIAKFGAVSMKDMGKVMGIANNKLVGKVDGKTLADIVKNKLSTI